MTGLFGQPNTSLFYHFLGTLIFEKSHFERLEPPPEVDNEVVSDGVHGRRPGHNEDDDGISHGRREDHRNEEGPPEGLENQSGGIEF